MNSRQQSTGRPSRSLRETIYLRYRSRYVGHDAPTTGTMEWKKRVFLPLLADLAKSAHILELGCGGGELLSIIEEAGWTNARGVDISPEQVERARNRGVTAELGDALEFLQSRQGPVDCIIAVDFFEHMTRDELATLLPRIHSVLSVDGKLILQTVNAAGVNGARVAYGDITHMTVFTESSIVQLLRAFGFERIEIEETGPRAIGIKGAIRVALWRTFRAIPKLVAYIESGARQRIWTENLVCTAVKGEA